MTLYYNTLLPFVRLGIVQTQYKNEINKSFLVKGNVKEISDKLK